MTTTDPARPADKVTSRTGDSWCTLSDIGWQLRTTAGRMAPKLLSRNAGGVDGFVKKMAAKNAGGEPDPSLEDELFHPDDVPEIVTRAR